MSIKRLTAWMKFHYLYISRVRKALKRIIKSYTKSLVHGIDVPEYWVDDDARIVYVVNPKAACSSIQSALYRYATGLAPPEAIHTAPETTRYRKSRLSGEQRKYFVFTFTRHPIDRVISCYKNKFSDVREKRHLRFEFADYLRGFFKRKDSFSQFVEKLAIIPPKYCDRHFMPQYDWIYDKCGVEPDFIGKIESLDRDWETLKDKIDGLPDIERVNPSRPTNIHIDEKSEAILLGKYKKDFQYFGYDLE